MVARDRFKYRFKLSGLRHNFASFRENIPKMSLEKVFESVVGECSKNERRMMFYLIFVGCCSLFFISL
jgi:hypothetical protein